MRVVAAVAVALVATAALLRLLDDDSERFARAPGPEPRLVDPGAPDPGGDDRAAIRLPPAHRWFGFSEGAFGSARADDMQPTVQRMADDGAAVGANAIRVALGWWDLEPRPGAHDAATEARVSRLVDAAGRRDARVVFVITSTPPWASTDPGDPAAAPRDDPEVDRAFAQFAAFVARRWPTALAIETWNEPNAGFAWHKPDPERYTRMHRAAAAAIRAANPRVEVLVGGLAGTARDTDVIMRPQRFLKRMFAAGLQPSDYDALAVHPYPGQADGRMASLGAGGFFAATLADFRAGYRDRDPDAVEWVTEVGLTTSGPGRVSERQQARGDVRLVRRVLSMPRVKAVFLHTQYDLVGRGDDDPERGFGVLTPRGAAPATPKPAFRSLRGLR